MVDFQAGAELQQPEPVEAKVGQGEPFRLRAQQRFEILQAGGGRSDAAEHRRRRPATGDGSKANLEPIQWQVRQLSW
jgi:hypothetical protein